MMTPRRLAELLAIGMVDAGMTPQRTTSDTVALVLMMAAENAGGDDTPEGVYLGAVCDALDKMPTD